MKSIRFSLILLLAIGSMAAAVSAREDSRGGPFWYKGNLHTHTTLSDGDSSPEKVIAWYREQGYNFLAISDHNLVMPTGPFKNVESEDFILISANEISDKFGEIPLHIMALGLADETLKRTGGTSIVDVLQKNIDSIRGAGAVPVLAHPNFEWAFTEHEILKLKNCFLFEVLNMHPRVNNLGGGGHPGTEEIWDRVLSTGRILYGIGTDDMHQLASYPGKSWVMVRADELSEKAILLSLEKGDFYVSTGIVLEKYEITKQALCLKLPSSGATRYTTTFIGRNGRALKTDLSADPAYYFSGMETYVRVKVVDSNGNLVLAQPVFLPLVGKGPQNL